MKGIKEALSRRRDEYKDFEDIPKPVRLILKQAYKREWRHLAEERIKNIKPSIPLGECFWKLSASEHKAIKTLFGTKEVRKMVTSLSGRDEDAKVDVIDAAYWMKGCSSLGRLRYAVLLRAGKKHGKQSDLCIIDIKEATSAAAPRASGGNMPEKQCRSSGRRRLEAFALPGPTDVDSMFHGPRCFSPGADAPGSQA